MSIKLNTIVAQLPMLLVLKMYFLYFLVRQLSILHTGDINQQQGLWVDLLVISFPKLNFTNKKIQNLNTTYREKGSVCICFTHTHPQNTQPVKCNILFHRKKSHLSIQILIRAFLHYLSSSNIKLQSSKLKLCYGTKYLFLICHILTTQWKVTIS